MRHAGRHGYSVLPELRAVFSGGARGLRSGDVDGSGGNPLPDGPLDRRGMEHGQGRYRYLRLAGAGHRGPEHDCPDSYPGPAHGRFLHRMHEENPEPATRSSPTCSRGSITSFPRWWPRWWWVSSWWWGRSFASSRASWWRRCTSSRTCSLWTSAWISGRPREASRFWLRSGISSRRLWRPTGCAGSIGSRAVLARCAASHGHCSHWSRAAGARQSILTP